MQLMAKSTAVEQERETKKKADELAKSVDEVMTGLDEFIKASVAGVTTEAKEKEKKALDDAALAKSLQESQAAEKTKKDKETEAELAKSLAGKEKPGEEAVELDGAEVIADFKKSMAHMIAKAVVSVRESLIEHITAELSKIRENQVLVAKALQVNGKLMHEVMHETVAIGDSGRPRKSMLTLLDKAMTGTGTTESGDAAPKLDGNKIMAKAMELNRLGKITPSDVSAINHYVQGGHPIPARFQQHFVLSELTA